ncbi:hypothetical protein RFI_03646, partial [Reticulomyxa filosa]
CEKLLLYFFFENEQVTDCVKILELIQLHDLKYNELVDYFNIPYIVNCCKDFFFGDEDTIARAVTGVHKSSFFHPFIERDENGYVYHMKYKNGGEAKDANKDTAIFPAEEVKETLATIAAQMDDDDDGGYGARTRPYRSFSTVPLREGNIRLVFWECKLKRICDINTTQETFRCRFHYYLTWLATKKRISRLSKLCAQTKKRGTAKVLVPSLSSSYRIYKYCGSP